jgi:hypothetical protein
VQWRAGSQHQQIGGKKGRKIRQGPVVVRIKIDRSGITDILAIILGRKAIINSPTVQL